MSIFSFAQLNLSELFKITKLSGTARSNFSLTGRFSVGEFTTNQKRDNVDFVKI
jgi:hypothetical protein